MVLTALVSDQELFERLVLKGGSAIELVHGVGMRSSVDLDFSIEGDFSPTELGGMQERLGALLASVFTPRGLRVFDVRFRPKPLDVSPDLAAFWGGYGLEFKLSLAADAERFHSDQEALRLNAQVVGPAQRKTFAVDISRHEYCGEKEEKSVEGHSVFVYSPRLIVSEKLRAICQQMPEYCAIVRRKHSSPRARDFFDITNLVERFAFRTATAEFLELTRTVFKAKRVPIELLWQIEGTKEFHRPDFQAVLDTVPPGTLIHDFDYYFGAVVALTDGLKPPRHP